MKTNRNPIAKNAFKFNKPKAIPARKGRGSSYSRVKIKGELLREE